MLARELSDSGSAEGMMSRARQLMEYIKVWHPDLSSERDKDEAIQWLNADFDRRSVTQSYDLVEDWKNTFRPESFKDNVFTDLESESGQLFINIDEKGEMKYGFVHRATYYGDLDFNNVLDAEQYLDKECNYHYRPDLIDSVKQSADENTKWIKENVQVLTTEELREMIDRDYGELHPRQDIPKETVLVGTKEYTLEDLENHLKNDVISNRELAEIEAAVWGKYKTLRAEFEKETGVDSDLSYTIELSESAEILVYDIDHIEELEAMTTDRMFDAVKKEIGAKELMRLLDVDDFSIVKKFKSCFLSDVDVNKEKETSEKEQPKTLQGLLAGAKEQKESMKTDHTKSTSKSKGQEL